MLPLVPRPSPVTRSAYFDSVLVSIYVRRDLGAVRRLIRSNPSGVRYRLRYLVCTGLITADWAAMAILTSTEPPKEVVNHLDRMVPIQTG